MDRLSIIAVVCPFIVQVLSVPVSAPHDGNIDIILNLPLFSLMPSKIAASQVAAAASDGGVAGVEAAAGVGGVAGVGAAAGIGVASEIASDETFAGVANGLPFGTLGLPAQGIPINMKQERDRLGVPILMKRVEGSPEEVLEMGIEDSVSEIDKREPFFRVAPFHPSVTQD